MLTTRLALHWIPCCPVPDVREIAMGPASATVVTLASSRRLIDFNEYRGLDILRRNCPRNRDREDISLEYNTETA